MLPWERKKQLTKKEAELLELEARGLTHEQIAQLWGVNRKSVDWAKWKINKKLSSIYIRKPGLA